MGFLLWCLAWACSWKSSGLSKRRRRFGWSKSDLQGSEIRLLSVGGKSLGPFPRDPTTFWEGIPNLLKAPVITTFLEAIWIPWTFCFFFIVWWWIWSSLEGWEGFLGVKSYYFLVLCLFWLLGIRIWWGNLGLMVRLKADDGSESLGRRAILSLTCFETAVFRLLGGPLVVQPKKRLVLKRLT